MMLSYGVPADFMDQYIHIGESTVIESHRVRQAGAGGWSWRNVRKKNCRAGGLLTSRTQALKKPARTCRTLAARAGGQGRRLMISV